MANIQTRKTKDGKTRYRVLVRLKGYPPQSATFEYKTDAKDWAKRTEAAIKEGRYFRTSEAMRHTLGELIDRYKEQVLPKKPKSEKRQSAQLDWWRKRLGDYRIADVTPPLIAEQRDKLAATPIRLEKDRSAGSVNRYLAALSHAFTVAMKEWNWADENPVRKVSKLKEPRGRVRYLTDDERTALLEACESSFEERLYPIVLFALSNGARQGEIMNLRWQDIDFERGVAILHETKNNERRAVPVTGLLAQALRDHGKVRRMDTDLVFVGPLGKAVFPRRAWEIALEQAEIEDFHFHDCRHSAASELAMSGATLADLAAVLGHKSLAMVKRYQHLTDQHIVAVVERMNERVFGGES